LHGVNLSSEGGATDLGCVTTGRSGSCNRDRINRKRENTIMGRLIISPSNIFSVIKIRDYKLG
jgi:hypothetical protein